MRVVFVQPTFPQEMPKFLRGLTDVGAEVIGAGQGPAAALPERVRRHLSRWVQIPDPGDEDGCVETLCAALDGVGPDRVESLWEPTVLLAARVRERLGVPGMSVDTVLGFRDKQLMKERAAAAGARTARAERVHGAEHLLEAAARVGYPIVVKPIAGAGTASTWRCDDPEALEGHLDELRHVPILSVETFIRGEEYTYDALCIDGVPVLESITGYFPPPIVARNEAWVSPAQMTYRNPYLPVFMPGIRLGRQVLPALGMGTGIAHMEWFRTPEGTAVLGEIACRPGGSKLMDQWNWSQGIDVYREWARALCWGACEAAPRRAFHVGTVFKRAKGEGRIQAVEGADRLRAELGSHIVEDALSPVGAPRRDWKQTLLSDGWIVVRHEQHDHCRALMDRVASEVHLFAG